ncbi:calpain-14 [Dromiciops gliroides]|uniref:calpain-14 n=1 Tax=Dromiciops gliroides TaxID=33562 RepID=UPI001CC5D392|nr:calpain-14 [Dromiciops gliroides]
MSLCSFLMGRSPKSHDTLFRRESFGRTYQQPYQDYETLLETCLRNNCLFEDNNFPADISSIGRGNLLQKLPQNLQWKRPTELCDNPVFYSAKEGRLGLCQGVLGNCWFLAALEALTFHLDILNQVVPLNQSFTKKYAGIFLFQFWHFGKWIPVVVDDRLPMNEAGQLVFVSSTCKNLFWAALLEKAYAKLAGSYEDLQIGHVSEAFLDFTGGVTATIELAKAPSNLWDILTRVTSKRSLIGCQTHSGERILDNGLVDGHAYTLTGMRKVTCHNGPEYLVRLRNPWGKVEWKGDWSDRSNKWDLLSPKEKILLLRDDEDGEFWMSIQDFKFHFTSLVICQLTPDLMTQEVGKKWMYSLTAGRWVKGSTAGGRLRHHRDMFWMNPQFQLTVLSADESKKYSKPCGVLISLMQKSKNHHRNQMLHLPIGTFLFRVGHLWRGNHRLPQEFFQRTTPLFAPRDFQKEREVSYEFALEPGTYLIVPCTSEPWQESEFILRVFSRKKHALYEMGSNCSFVLPKEIVDRYEREDEFFTKLFEKYPEINAIQLQKILNNMTWTHLSSPQPTFSMNACLGILALLDLNATGTVSIQEFRYLWKRLLIYQEVFHKQDKDNLGFLESWQLRAAAQGAGILLSDEVCNLMAIRYGNSNRKIGFENFVYFMLRVEIMEDAFQNLTHDNKGIYLLKSETMFHVVVEKQSKVREHWLNDREETLSTWKPLWEPSRRGWYLEIASIWDRTAHPAFVSPIAQLSPVAPRSCNMRRGHTLPEQPTRRRTNMRHHKGQDRKDRERAPVPEIARLPSGSVQYSLTQKGRIIKCDKRKEKNEICAAEYQCGCNTLELGGEFRGEGGQTPGQRSQTAALLEIATDNPTFSSSHPDESEAINIEKYFIAPADRKEKGCVPGPRKRHRDLTLGVPPKLAPELRDPGACWECPGAPLGKLLTVSQSSRQ